MNKVVVRRRQGYEHEIELREHRLIVDEPQEKGGGDQGPTPAELLAASLASCTAITLEMYADRKGWPLSRSRVAVRHDKVAGQTSADVFTRRIALEGPLDGEHTARLMEIAGKCPVHRTLEAGSRVITEPFPEPPPASDARAKDAEAHEHFRDMDAECRKAGAPG